MRWLKTLLVALPLLILLGAAAIFWRLDAIVRSTVEAQASTQLNVPARLGSADVGVLGGTVGLGKFSLGSPKGFEAPSMLTVDAVDVGVAYRELARSPIRVQSIRIDRPTLVVERGPGGLNVKALIDGLPPTDPDAEVVRLIIGRLTVESATVRIRPGLPGLPEAIELPIPSLEVSNIGTADDAQNGAAVRDVVLTVISALTDAAAKSDRLPKELKDIFALDVQQLAREKIRGVGKEIERAIEKVGRDPTRIDEVGKELERGLKDVITGGAGKQRPRATESPTTAPNPG
mgnify:CR=1 FL=1